MPGHYVNKVPQSRLVLKKSVYPGGLAGGWELLGTLFMANVILWVKMCSSRFEGHTG